MYHANLQMINRGNKTAIMVPYSNPLVFIARIMGWDMKRFYMETRENANVLFANALKEFWVRIHLF